MGIWTLSSEQPKACISAESGPLTVGRVGSTCHLSPKPAMMPGVPSSGLHPPWKPRSPQLSVRHDPLGGEVTARGEGDRRPPGLVQVQMLRACGCLLDLWEVVQCGRGLHLPVAEEVQGQDDHEHTRVERGGDEQGDQRHQHSQAVSRDGVRGLGPTPTPTPTLASASTLSWKVAGLYFQPGLTPEGQTSLLPNAGAVHTNCPIYTSRATPPALCLFSNLLLLLGLPLAQERHFYTTWRAGWLVNVLDSSFLCHNHSVHHPTLSLLFFIPSSLFTSSLFTTTALDQVTFTFLSYRYL